ncbi:MAG TPA: TolC family protein [Desulfobacteraceae bacterium]|nr:TolC family protein [Desulfobacteraceae bacterium]
MTGLIRIFTGLIYLVPVLFVNVHQAGSTESPEVMSLESCIEAALDNNRDLKSRAEAIERAGHIARQTKADFYPKLGTDYRYNRQDRARSLNFGSTPIPSTVKDNFSWNVSVTQPLFTGFSLTAAHEISKLGVDTSRLDYQIEKLDLVFRVKEAYFAVLEADKGVEVARSAVESLESNVKVARDFYNVGIIPINDVLKAEVELAKARQTLVEALNGSSLARSSFNTILSRSIETPVMLEDILVYRPEEGKFQDYVDTAMERRPEMKIIDNAISRADQEITLAKSPYYPEVGLTYRYMREGDEPDVSGSVVHDSSRWDVTAGLSWTLWDWGKARNAVAEKKRGKSELLYNRQSLEDAIRLEVKSAVLSLEGAEKNIPTTRKALEQAEENLRVNEERYRAQVTTITEVLDAQALLTRARVDYYRSLYGHNVARARLLRAMGED